VQAAKVARAFIDVATECRALRNYFALFAIVGGLQATPVARLHTVWESVDRRAAQALRKLRSDVCDGARSHRVYRALVAAQEGSLRVPVIALTLAHLSAVEQTPTYADDDDDDDNGDVNAVDGGGGGDDNDGDDLSGSAAAMRRIHFSKFIKAYRQLAPLLEAGVAARGGGSCELTFHFATTRDNARTSGGTGSRNGGGGGGSGSGGVGGGGVKADQHASLCGLLERRWCVDVLTPDQQTVASHRLVSVPAERAYRAGRARLEGSRP
jgi:hypothetical protein